MTAAGSRRRTRTLAAVATVGLGALLALAPGASPAQAHNVVVSTSPGTDSTVEQAPDDVSVTFDDVVLNLAADGSSTVVSVTDAAGAEHATGCPTTKDRTIAVPVSITEPGDYTVSWRVVSADGHPVSGTFGFTYAPGDGGGTPSAATSPDGAAGGAAPGASCGSADATSGAASGSSGSGGSVTDGQGSAPAGSSSDLAVVLGVLGGVVVLAGGAVLVALLVSRRRG